MEIVLPFPKEKGCKEKTGFPFWITTVSAVSKALIYAIIQI